MCVGLKLFGQYLAREVFEYRVARSLIFPPIPTNVCMSDRYWYVRDRRIDRRALCYQVSKFVAVVIYPFKD